MLPVETVEAVLFFLSRLDLEAAQLTNRYCRDVIGNQAFTSQAALRLIPHLQLASDGTFSTNRSVRREPYVLNGDDNLLRWVRSTCVERLYLDARLHSAVGWYLTHRRQTIAIEVHMTLPFASDELHRSFFHEAPDVPWSEFHAPANFERGELRSADVVRSRTHIPLISPALRSCYHINLPNLGLNINAAGEDIFEWIGQPSATYHQRRVSLDYDSIHFRSHEDGLISHLRGMREAFPRETVANPCYIEFRGVPQSILDRKSEFEHRKCNRHTMEYFEILVVYPDVIVRRRPLF